MYNPIFPLSTNITGERSARTWKLPGWCGWRSPLMTWPIAIYKQKNHVCIIYNDKSVYIYILIIYIYIYNIDSNPQKDRKVTSKHGWYVRKLRIPIRSEKIQLIMEIRGTLCSDKLYTYVYNMYIYICNISMGIFNLAIQSIYHC